MNALSAIKSFGLAKSLPWTRLIVLRIASKHFGSQSSLCDSSTKTLETTDYFDFHDKFDGDQMKNIVSSMIIHNDFLSVEEEQSVLAEVQPYMKRLRYEFDHWDDAIHGYRETEKLKWNEDNTKIIERLRALAFPPGTPQLAFVHVLDLDAKGLIKPHIDSTRFCGSTIAGISLLSNAVMRLVHDKRKDQVVDILLKQRSLYIMKDHARFEYTHEILGNEDSKFKGEPVPRARRISVMCRNEPSSGSTS